MAGICLRRDKDADTQNENHARIQKEDSHSHGKERDQTLESQVMPASSP